MAKNKPKTDISTKALQELGLNENEAVLYSLMLNRPRSTVQELETRSLLPRTMLYYVLKQLAQRGLVSTKKDSWKTTYIAEDPEHLYDILSHREREFERETNIIRELIPRLKHQYRLAGKRPNVRIFDGAAGYQKALEDIIVSQPKEILAYETLARNKPGFEIQNAHEKRRIARKIQKNVLFFETEDALRLIKQRPYDDFTQFRSVAEELEAFEAGVLLYDGKLLYISYPDEHEPTAVLVEDQSLYLMQKNIFTMLWKRGKDRTLAFTE